MHAGEDDDLGLGACGLAGEAQRVADVVGDVLHLGPLIVVREHDRVALAGQLADLRLHAATSPGVSSSGSMTGREIDAGAVTPAPA